MSQYKTGIMKTLIFILLKITEIVAVLLTYLGLCYSGYYTINFFESFFANPEPVLNTGFQFYFLCPLGMASMLLLIGLILMILYKIFPDWIEKNKEWSDSIHKRLFK